MALVTGEAIADFVEIRLTPWRVLVTFRGPWANRIVEVLVRNLCLCDMVSPTSCLFKIFKQFRTITDKVVTKTTSLSPSPLES